MNGKRRLRRDKRILANDLYNVSVDHLPPPVVAKPAATSSTASAPTFCYFYSQGGKRHPVAKHVMYLTQPLKSWLRALEGVVEVALEGLHISFPDIPDNMMGAVVSFLHTGIAQGDVDLQWEICTVLVEVFGFPNNMNLKKLEFNSEAYQQITNVPGINSERCEICMKGCSLREIYPHAKEHAQASLSLAYLASKSKDKTSCVFCSVDIAGGKGNAGGGIQQEIKAHHNRHLKDLAKRLNKRYKYEVMDPDLTAAAADNEGGGEASHLRIVSVSSGAKAAAAATLSSSSRPTTSTNVGLIPPPGGRSPRHHGLKQLPTVKREPGSISHATYQTESATAYASIYTATAAGRPCVSERQISANVSGPRRTSGSSRRRISSSSSASSSSAAATASDVTSERSCTPEERQPAALAASAASAASSKTKATIQNGASSASSVPSSKHQNGTNAYGRAGGKPQSLMPTTPAAAAAVPAAAVKTSQSSCGGSEGGVKRRTGPRPGPASKKKKMMLSAAAAASSPAAAAAASSTTAATAPPQPAAVNRGASFSSSAELPYFPTVSSESDEDELIFD